MSIEELEVLPDAARTIEGLRDTGYDFLTAAADIIDNSIAADATKVIVTVTMALDGQLEVSVADNGYGMSKDELLNAMKYGSRVRASAASLGKFGLGLKTASTSICRQLTVITRPASLDGTFAAEWDLDYVASQNKWLLRLPDVNGHEMDILEAAAGSGSGTVVLWRKIDRLLPRQYQDAQGAAAQTALRKIVDSLRRHVALTYVRYLSGEDRPKITIEINDIPAEPWDPFWRPRSEVLLDKVVPVKLDGQSAEFRLRAYVLPPRTELTDAEQKEARISTDWQGFYVFREDRVISAGGWLGMAQVEPHDSLCRVELSFDHRLDAALQIDIKKSRIKMLADLQEAVRKMIAPARSEAEERYRKNVRTTATKDAPSIHAPANSAVGNHIGGLNRTTVTVTGDGRATVANPRGLVEIEIPTMEEADGGPYVVVKPDLDDGLLWRPVSRQKNAVLLNAGHPFYERAYSALKAVPVGVQAVDFLLWALCEAEL